MEEFQLLWWEGITPDTPIREIGWTYVIALLVLVVLIGLVVDLRKNW